jgi:hypothetical protein
VIVVLDPLRVQRRKVNSLSDLRLTIQDTDRIVGVSIENLPRSQLELPRLNRLHHWHLRAVEASRADSHDLQRSEWNGGGGDTVEVGRPPRPRSEG